MYGTLPVDEQNWREYLSCSTLQSSERPPLPHQYVQWTEAIGETLGQTTWSTFIIIFRHRLQIVEGIFLQRKCTVVAFKPILVFNFSIYL